MFKYVITLLVSVLFLKFSIAQVTNKGQPLSWKVENQINIEAYKLPDFNLKARLKQDSIRDLNASKPYRFGKEFLVDIDIDRDGQWINLPNGQRIWVMNIKSSNAKTMNFVFDEFYLPQGAKLYLYNEEKTDLLGAYTSSQNQESGYLGTWLVDGDNIWITYQEPAGTNEKVKLHISKAVHGYRSVTDFENAQKDLNDSGDCNLDVDCSIGSDFDDKKDELKKSVALMLNGNSSFCTGTLINNTNNDGSQYFLTANHCLGGNPASWVFRFNWVSPNPQCATFNSSPDGDFDESASGSSILASNSKSDMALLEINPTLPDSWDLVWAGWDRSGTSPNFTVGIHHPSGDIMKTCRNDDPAQPTTTSFNGESTMEIWLIDNWELGVTEPGSSGSALFDQDGRIIGQLAGGTAACDGNSNNGQIDFYGRFDVSWDFGNSASSRLKDWLDPGDTGILTLDQYPSSQVFANDAAIFIENLPNETCEGQVNPDIIIANNGTAPLTSATIEYQFNNEGINTINWTGNLAQGEEEVATSLNYTATSISNSLTASLLQPNNVTDENQSNNSFTGNFDKPSSYDTQQNVLNLTINTDDFGNETTWELIDDAGSVIANGGSYPDNVSINETITIADLNCYEFIIYDAASDGICCDFGNGSYMLETDNQEVIVSGGNFGNLERTSFRIDNNLSTAHPVDKSNIKIYPNPATSILNIDLTESTEATDSITYSYTFYNMIGQKIKTGKFEGKGTTIQINNLSSGIYLLQLKDNEALNLTKRIIKK